MCISTVYVLYCKYFNVLCFKIYLHNNLIIFRISTKMVVPESGVMCDHIMRGIEKNGGGIHLHNRKQKLKQK